MNRETLGPEEAQREITHNTRRFLDGRLSDPSVLVWAARLGPERMAEREAVRSALSFPHRGLAEPFRTGWRHVLESWSSIADPDFSAAEISHGIEAGADPGLFLAEIVDLVTPRLTIDASGLFMARRTGPPTTVGDLFYSQLSSHGLYRLDRLGLGALRDADLLAELVDRLEGALVQSLHRARRLSEAALRSANRVGRVFVLPARAEEEDAERDPDLYRSGFAPLARLFSEVLDRLVDIDVAAALTRADRLALLPWPLARRLWAAAARRPDFIDGEAVGRWLASQDDEAFWSIGQFPEVGELRAVRFGDFDTAQQARIEARLLKRPQAKLFGAKLDKTVRERLRDEAAGTELRRIQAAGHSLSPAARAWLDKLPASAAMSSPREDLYGSDRYIPDAPTPIYALVDGAALIERLDKDLKGRLYVEGRPAMDYVFVNSDAVFEQLSALPEPHRFPRVWAALASAAREEWIGAEPEGVEAIKRLPRAQAMLEALHAQPVGALDQAIDGVSYWIDGVAKALGRDQRFRELWRRLWPAAVQATNGRAAEDKAEERSVPLGEDDHLETQALNSPAGRMISAFFTLLPNLKVTSSPFDDPDLRRMRQDLVDAKGVARLQGLYRLLTALGYMRQAEPDWADEHLIGPLRAGDGNDLRLWEAISQIGLLPLETMTAIGPDMARVVQGSSLSETVRAGLAERLVLSVLGALHRVKAEPVSLTEVVQMLRLGGDTVRTACASAMARFMEAETVDRPHRYERSVKVLLTRAWPLDRAARSPMLSKRLARIPATTGAAFSACVDDVRGLLVPFKAWSLREYGLYAKGETSEPRLAYPNTRADAIALVTLLDRTIGEQEGAIAPREMDLALQAAVAKAPKLANDSAYRRLLSLARR